MGANQPQRRGVVGGRLPEHLPEDLRVQCLPGSDSTTAGRHVQREQVPERGGVGAAGQFRRTLLRQIPLHPQVRLSAEDPILEQSPVLLQQSPDGPLRVVDRVVDAVVPQARVRSEEQGQLVRRLFAGQGVEVRPGIAPAQVGMAINVARLHDHRASLPCEFFTVFAQPPAPGNGLLEVGHQGGVAVPGVDQDDITGPPLLGQEAGGSAMIIAGVARVRPEVTQ